MRNSVLLLRGCGFCGSRFCRDRSGYCRREIARGADMDVVAKRISYFSASIAMFLLLFVLLLLQGSLTAVKAEEIDAKQFVDDAISSNRLVIFSKSYCP